MISKHQILAAMDADFCIRLMSHLTNSLQAADVKQWDRLWCDGISVPEMYEQLPDEPNTILSRCWFGKTGQDPHWLRIALGPLALELIEKKQDLTGAFPNEGDLSWISVDEEECWVDVQLK